MKARLALAILATAFVAGAALAQRAPGVGRFPEASGGAGGSSSPTSGDWFVYGDGGYTGGVTVNKQLTVDGGILTNSDVMSPVVGYRIGKNGAVTNLTCLWLGPVSWGGTNYIMCDDSSFNTYFNALNVAGRYEFRVANAEVARIRSAGHIASTTPFAILAASPGAAATTAGQVVGAQILPAEPFTINKVSGYTLTAGAGGSTAWTVRISDGTNNCTATGPACNAAAGAWDATLSGTCAFAASQTLTMTVQTIGDCATGPVFANIQPVGFWKI